MRFIFAIFILTNLSLLKIKGDELCHFDENNAEVTCDGTNITTDENQWLPSNFNCLAARKYVFKNFRVVPEHAFENITFPSDEAILLELFNVETLSSRAFSDRISIPTGSNLSVVISGKQIEFRHHAFYRVKIERLELNSIDEFSSSSIFDSDPFSDSVEIGEFIFNRTSLTPFKGSETSKINVKNVRIIDSPLVTKLDKENLPNFLARTKSFQISNTNLVSIDQQTFPVIDFAFQLFAVTNNSFLKKLTSNFFQNELQQLETVDFSFNSIEAIDSEQFWTPFRRAKNLSLKGQRIDVFLQSKVFSSMENLETIDFSFGQAGNLIQNQTFFEDFGAPSSSLVSIDLSATDLTEPMITEWLDVLSRKASRTLKVFLHGKRLSDEAFCDYYRAFDAAPHLIELHLDSDHPCNCVVDLFFRYGVTQSASNSEKPYCVADQQRPTCNITNQLTASKCRITRPNTDNPTDGSPILGQYGIIGIGVGASFILFVVLAIGSRRVYRNRKRRIIRSRTSTVADMEYVVDDPDTVYVQDVNDSSLSA